MTKLLNVFGWSPATAALSEQRIIADASVKSTRELRREFEKDLFYFQALISK